jgi:VanZ like protein
MSRKLIILAAWCVLGSITFVTLSPIGLRPETGSVNIERFLAYSLLGTLFVMAYPQHFLRVVTLILVVASALELLQHLTPDRHGHIADAGEKIAGGVAGASIARLAQLLFRARA